MNIILKLLGLNYSKWYNLKVYNKSYNSYLLQARLNSYDNSIQFKNTKIVSNKSCYSDLDFNKEFANMISSEVLILNNIKEEELRSKARMVQLELWE